MIYFHLTVALCWQILVEFAGWCGLVGRCWLHTVLLKMVSVSNEVLVCAV
jgi:hypothetical protein